GWSGYTDADDSEMRINDKYVAAKTYDFGDDNASKTIAISFESRTHGGWEPSGEYEDFFSVLANGQTMLYSSLSSDGYKSTHSFNVALDENGKVQIEMTVDATFHEEGVSVKNVQVVSAGSDILYAAENKDTAIYDGIQSDYQFGVDQGLLTVTNTVNGAVDTLDGIETLEFADGSIEVSDDANGDYTLTGSSILEPIILSSDVSITQENITGFNLSDETDGALAEIEAIIQSDSLTEETSDASVTNFLFGVEEGNLAAYAEMTLVDSLSLDQGTSGSPDDLIIDNSLEQLLGINDPLDDEMLNLIGLSFEENETSSMLLNDDVVYVNFDPTPDNLDKNLADTNDGYTISLVTEPGDPTQESFG
ncbi:hypothetical protein N8000_02200, partial [Rhodospirillales bacterium]|nr:hypothetical protein [Rhodospirillales bacterium]